jgi:hypothetical protein
VSGRGLSGARSEDIAAGEEEGGGPGLKVGAERQSQRRLSASDVVRHP